MMMINIRNMMKADIRNMMRAEVEENNNQENGELEQGSGHVLQGSQGSQGCHSKTRSAWRTLQASFFSEVGTRENTSLAAKRTIG